MSDEEQISRMVDEFIADLESDNNLVGDVHPNLRRGFKAYLLKWHQQELEHAVAEARIIPESVTNQIIEDYRDWQMKQLKGQQFNRVEIPDEVIAFAIERFMKRTHRYPVRPYVIPGVSPVNFNLRQTHQ